MSDMILVIVMVVSVEWFVIVDIMIGISVSVLVSFSFQFVGKKFVSRMLVSDDICYDVQFVSVIFQKQVFLFGMWLYVKFCFWNSRQIMLLLKQLIVRCCYSGRQEKCGVNLVLKIMKCMLIIVVVSSMVQIGSFVVRSGSIVSCDEFVQMNSDIVFVCLSVIMDLFIVMLVMSFQDRIVISVGEQLCVFWISVKWLVVDN